MAFYTGVANDFAALRQALIDACVTEGWSFSDGILSKGVAYVRPYVSTTQTVNLGPGLLIEGGTGVSGGTLTGGSNVHARLGRAGASAGYVDIDFPVSYNLHIFSDPDEVFLVIRYSVNHFGWLAFGVSDLGALPGTGLWLAGCVRMGYITHNNNQRFAIAANSGGSAQANSGQTSASIGPGFFWCTLRSTMNIARQDTIHADLDGGGWMGGVSGTNVGAFNAIFPVAPLVERQPNDWNQEACLIPIMGHIWRASSKCSLVVEVRNARYIRVDNYEPGDLLALGDESWIVYPFYLKNTSARDGGTSLGHSGTFGWAIRYDGV